MTKSEAYSVFPAMQLVADGLTCQRGGKTVFRKLDFTLLSGEALIVTGPNGAGKSSLLRLVAGLVDVAVGHLSLEGGKDDAVLCEQAHYIGHLDALKAAMTVRETLQFWTDFLGGAASDIVAAVEAFDLATLMELPVAYLSAGQRRRLSLARLLVAPRALWLLDEPSVALDAASLTRLVHIMEGHLKRGGMIMAATHQALGLSEIKTLDLGLLKVGA